MDGSGLVYVAVACNDLLQVFSSDGAFLFKWGSQGGVDGQFQDPKGIAVDGSGRVYVADTFNNRIQKFQP